MSHPTRQITSPTTKGAASVFGLRYVFAHSVWRAAQSGFVRIGRAGRSAVRQGEIEARNRATVRILVDR